MWFVGGDAGLLHGAGVEQWGGEAQLVAVRLAPRPPALHALPAAHARQEGQRRDTVSKL